MKNFKKNFNNFIYLWNSIEKSIQYKFFILILLTIVAAICEFFTIGAVLPFLTVLISPELILNNAYLSDILLIFNISEYKEVQFYSVLVFIFIALISSAVRLYLLLFQTKLCFSVGGKFSCKILDNILNMNYSYHVSSDSSQLISGITAKVTLLVNAILLPVVVIFSSCIILLTILTLLFLVMPYIAFFSFSFLFISYFLINKFSKVRLKKSSEDINFELSNVIKLVQENVGGIRDIIIDGTQKYFLDIYKISDSNLRSAQSFQQILGATPKYILEFLGIVIIVLTTYFMLNAGYDINIIIPLIGLLSLSAQRMLPVLQQLFVAVINIQGAMSLLESTLVYLKLNNIKTGDFPEKLKFYSGIEFRNVSFRYPGNLTNTLTDLNFKIPKGSFFGIKGPTGMGKSTLLDLIMGLQSPSSGEILVDGKNLDKNLLESYRKILSHVPQSLYIKNSSIRENIIFGRNDIVYDDIFLNFVVENACLSKTIDDLPDRFESIVGERGINLSGGQKQRIGVARSLFRSPEILVLDESTSGLDEITELKLLKNISKLPNKVTVVIVSHRQSSFEFCDFIFDMTSNTLVKNI
jgi:ABC-type multidrug transport system fused ATPase/permease subunit